MSQLTIYGIDKELQKKIEGQAKQRGLSVNQYILDLLHEAINQANSDVQQKVYHDLDHLAGTWSQNAFDKFNLALADQRQIDNIFNQIAGDTDAPDFPIKKKSG